MRKGPYYSEDILVEKMQRGEYNWLDYINHFSEEGRTSMKNTAVNTR